MKFVDDDDDDDDDDDVSCGAISLLTGGISVKPGTNIHHVSGYC